MNVPWRILDLAILAALAAPPAFAEPPTAVLVEGEPFRGELVAVNAQWQLQLKSGQTQRHAPAADLVKWGAWVEPLGGPLVLTADGGLLVADVFRADAEQLTVDSALFGALKLPLDCLAGVLFDPPSDRRMRDRLLERVARAGGESDRLVLHNGDELTGLIESLEDDSVSLGTDAGAVKIETHRIAAMVFDPSLRRKIEPEGLRAWTGFADGTRLLATQLLLEGSVLQVTTALGPTWRTSAGELAALQPLGGRVVYLSDLEPAGYLHVPYLDLAWPYQADRNVTGGLMRCGGRLYLKGLGVHTAARLTYTLDETCRRFEAELGVDDCAGAGGSVRYRVFLDDRQKYTSETIRGGGAAVPVSIDVAGGKRLLLVVDFAERADELDRADWLDARLIKRL
ncbi:MAG: NPCBM/NEW2 domain-containing protein [Pirellulales bacterium]|nr:NPCBM/NEW2 domain-containing protein [Pirellulales bacterium]